LASLGPSASFHELLVCGSCAGGGGFDHTTNAIGL